MLLLILVCGTTNAAILKQHKRSCGAGYPAGAMETWTFFQDDCTGKYYSLWVTCSGSHYMNTPEPNWDVYADPLAENPFTFTFWDLLHVADMSVPGGMCGYFITTATGQPVFFYNLRNADELAEAEAAWQRVSESSGITIN